MQLLVVFLLFAALFIGRLSQGNPRRAYILFGLIAVLVVGIELPLLWH